jgi:hypothetical protein
LVNEFRKFAFIFVGLYEAKQSAVFFLHFLLDVLKIIFAVVDWLIHLLKREGVFFEKPMPVFFGAQKAFVIIHL